MRLFTKVFILTVMVVVAVSGRRCPKGVPLVECFVNPCDVATCPKNPHAKCVPNFCGGCIAEFFERQGKKKPACCGGLGQSCDPGYPIAREDDCTCEDGLHCHPLETTFDEGICQNEPYGGPVPKG